MGAKPVPGKYVNKDEAGGEMVKYLSDALFEHRAEKVRKSPVFSVGIDKETDRTKEPHLSSVVRFIDGRWLVTVKWELAGMNEKNASAINRSLRASLARGGVDEKKCGAFGSDGAAVMRGRLNGVDKKFEQTAGKVVSSHCALHRCALSISSAGKDNENAKEADTTIRALHVLAKSSDDNIRMYLEVRRMIGTAAKLPAGAWRRLMTRGGGGKGQIPTRRVLMCKGRLGGIPNPMFHRKREMTPMIRTGRSPGRGGGENGESSREKSSPRLNRGRDKEE
uniref:DUF4371 domain-containing protein n=1 Tax=Chromera velia CCMP2878 TaxID=1169474 RepID=A0A0G4I249_9ALVE|eukprot:Cvel_34961.t1-p1 / transcript=Cvel_34961.t1 / gene=Cvel_34961 / organism=Chromera_velia_CCMP2878 / gene_product=Zinc finger protein 862, putative / transcript_product=Zinc finger protein 862, putative / location=Cvel_scaffold6198:1634-3301(+) / protein_length=278 / sequence_SO=supercontig / SO=protein_coding / is_pseudo=false